MQIIRSNHLFRAVKISVQLFLTLLLLMPVGLRAQQRDSIQSPRPAYDWYDPYKKVNVYYRVTLLDGQFRYGYLIRENEWEVVLRTKRLGDVSIPKQTVESIMPYRDPKTTDRRDPIFANRYFLMSSAEPIDPGDHYVLINLWGPELQMGVAPGFTASVQTTWIANPVLVGLRYGHEIKPYLHVGAGLLYGGDLFQRGNGNFFLPTATATLGDRRYNLSLGLGQLHASEQPQLRGTFLSTGGFVAVSDRLAVLFEAGRLSGGGAALLMPGVRWQRRRGGYIQLAAVGLTYPDPRAPEPPIAGTAAPANKLIRFPFVSWIRRF